MPLAPIGTDHHSACVRALRGELRL
jgi:hypothetical protein